MKTYVTFGQVHVHSVNGKTFDKDCVAVLEAPTEQEGRARAFELFKGVFCFTYPEQHWDRADMRFYPRGYINVDGGTEIEP